MAKVKIWSKYVPCGWSMIEQLETYQKLPGTQWATDDFVGKIKQISGISSPKLTFSLFICTLISENQGLEKSRSASNLRKFSGPANLDFFSVCHLDFFLQIYSINLAFFLGGDLEKSPGLQDLNFSKVWNRPWFLKTLIFRNQSAKPHNWIFYHFTISIAYLYRNS